MEIKSNHPILVVEDSDDDFEATKRAFKKANLINPIYRCVTGDQALDYIYYRGDYHEDKPRQPIGLILLDLNLPGTDGHEVLRIIKSDETTKQIPVVILTTSNAPKDIEDCYAKGANSYIQKPVNLEGFLQAIARLKEFWFEVATLPKPDSKA